MGLSPANWNLSVIQRNPAPKPGHSSLHLSLGTFNAALLTWYQVASPHTWALPILSLYLECSLSFLCYWTKCNWEPCFFPLCDPSPPSALQHKTVFLLHPGWIELSLNACWVFLDAGLDEDTFPYWQGNNLIILIMCSSCTIPILDWLLSEFYYRNASRHS